MDSFNFEIVLNYAMEFFSIKPPSSLSALLEITKEKFDLTKISRLVYINEDDEEIKLSTDSDYMNMFDYVDNNNLTEIELIVKSDGDKSKRKKSLRKRSSMNKIPSSGFTQGDGCVNGKRNLTLRSL